jgi:hypothetical protein
MNRPSQANQPAFERAVDLVAEAAQQLVRSITTSAPPRSREEEMRRARERSRQRFGSSGVVNDPVSRSVR